MANHLSGAVTTTSEAGLLDVLSAVAPRLRALRQNRGTTLAEVSVATGISISTLSRLESGHRRPTLDHLLPLAREYRVALDDLVGAPATGDPRIRPQPIRRNGVTYIPLSHRTDGLHAFKIVYPGRTDATPLTQRSHEGYDWLYVLSGRLRLALGDTETVLETGEAAEFDTRTPHGFASGDHGTAEILSLVSSQGERIHIRDV